MSKLESFGSPEYLLEELRKVPFRDTTKSSKPSRTVGHGPKSAAAGPNDSTIWIPVPFHPVWQKPLVKAVSAFNDSIWQDVPRNLLEES